MERVERIGNLMAKLRSFLPFCFLLIWIETNPRASVLTFVRCKNFSMCLLPCSLCLQALATCCLPLATCCSLLSYGFPFSLAFSCSPPTTCCLTFAPCRLLPTTCNSFVHGSLQTRHTTLCK